ncbi:MAG: LytTR family DNA-binding domain-containing protein [Bacteroidales bacterium]
MITCIAIDDEPLALEQICAYIGKVPELQLAGRFSRAVEALDFLRNQRIDLLFADINMPDLSGMDLVKSLAQPPKVIFTTAHREFAVEGFQVDAADYLVKPISLPAFLKAVDKTLQRYFSYAADKEAKPNDGDPVRREEEFLFIRSEYKIVRIAFRDITYIVGMRDYIRIHLENQRPVMALTGIRKMAGHLPAPDFMQVHRSYIVNLNKITTVERHRIRFGPDVRIPVSEPYREAFQAFLDKRSLK